MTQYNSSNSMALSGIHHHMNYSSNAPTNNNQEAPMLSTNGDGEHLHILHSQNCEHNCHLIAEQSQIGDNDITNPSQNNVNLLERCRFCGQELVSNAAIVAEHFNNHYRQFNLEALNSPCSYDQHHQSIENRLNNSPHYIQHTHNHGMMNSNQNITNLVQTHVMNNNQMSANNASEFHYNYSPQSEPSNLTLPNGHIKCTNDSHDQNLRIHNLSCNGIKESSNNVNCNDVFMPNNNRSSPLNLTGRQKIIPSPVLSRNIVTSNDQSNTSILEENNCVILSNSLQHREENNIHTNSQTIVANAITNNNSPQLQYPSNFTSNNYYQTHYPYNSHQSIQTELPSCRLQNFSNNLENVGLTIPVLSPNLGSIHQEQRNEINPENIAQMHQHDSLQINQTENLSAQCSLHNSPKHSNVITHTQDISYPHNCSPIINVSDCDQSSNDAKNINNLEHLPQFHCITCQKSFSNKLMYTTHMSNHPHEESNANSCKIEVADANGQSTNNYSTGSCLINNLNSTANLSSCDDINKPGPSQAKPMESTKPYKCSICNEEFNVKEDLHKHIVEHEASKPFHCDLCGIGVSNQRALKRHKLTHSGHKPYKCSVCGKSFLQKHDLNRHSNIHDKPKYFSCNQCKRSFTAVSSFKSHKCKATKGSRPFLCHICGDGCSNRLAWSYHMWKHTKNPKFVPFQEHLLPVETS